VSKVREKLGTTTGAQVMDHNEPIFRTVPLISVNLE
jgi:hypothetical protein